MLCILICYIYAECKVSEKYQRMEAKCMDFYRELLFLMRYVDFSHVVWHSMVDCFVLFLVRMERIKRIGLVAA